MSTEDDQFEIAAVTRMTFPDETGLRRGAHGDGVVVLQRYLDRFGWSAVADGDFGPKTESALRRFQAFHGLATTGVLDEPTVERMGTPRCGNPDIPRVNVLGFVLEGSRWDRTDLRYAFENFTDDLGRGDIRGAVIGAFAAWSSVTRLTFTEVAPDEALELRLRWVTGNHGDGERNAFDGFGGTYAHAYYPQDGHIHFDDEPWTVTAGGLFLGPDLQTLATHEIGHALGLEHSSVGDAIMRPHFLPLRRQRWLHPDDVAGIQQIYGSPVGRWSSLGGGLTSGPAACPTGNGTMAVFARGEDNAIWFARGSTGGFGDWTSIGGGLTSGPAACSPQPGRIDVFARGEDNAMWHTWFDGGWHDWVSRGGGFTSGPAACPTGNGTMAVFARGEDNAIWHNFGPQWYGWTSLGGGLTSDPGACSPAPERIDVFARGQDNAIWHTW
jgi:hypothetical protein